MWITCKSENVDNFFAMRINVENLKEMYPDLAKNAELIKNVIIEEKNKFVKTLAHGEKEFEKEMPISSLC